MGCYCSGSECEPDEKAGDEERADVGVEGST